MKNFIKLIIVAYFLAPTAEAKDLEKTGLKRIDFLLEGKANATHGIEIHEKKELPWSNSDKMGCKKLNLKDIGDDAPKNIFMEMYFSKRKSTVFYIYDKDKIISSFYWSSLDNDSEFVELGSYRLSNVSELTISACNNDQIGDETLFIYQYEVQ